MYVGAQFSALDPVRLTQTGRRGRNRSAEAVRRARFAVAQGKQASRNWWGTCGATTLDHRP